MNVKQVADALQGIFASERIVFWNDPAKDFLSLFEGEMFSPVEGVSVIRLDETPALREHLNLSRRFLDAKDRFARLGPLLHHPPEPAIEAIFLHGLRHQRHRLRDGWQGGSLRD